MVRFFKQHHAILNWISTTLMALSLWFARAGFWTGSTSAKLESLEKGIATLQVDVRDLRQALIAHIGK